MSFDGEDVQERENLLEDEVGADATSSSESDDDDAEKPRKSKVSIEKLLKTAFQEIADGKRNLTRSDDLAAFRSRDVHDLASDSGTKGAQTALHMLLDERGPDFPKVDDDQMKALITALVQHSNNLLAKGDREGKTPLYLAIDNKREKELEWLVEAHPKINTILQKSSNKQQYLHMAIKKKLKYFRQLVRKADDKTLALRDAKGNTILHLAVEWKRCRKDQLSVIEEIVAKSDKAVQEANGDFNRAGKSPYLHHRKTVREAKELAAAELRKQSENPPGRGRGEDFKNAAEPASTSNKTAARPVSPTRTPIVGVQVPRGFDMGPQPGLDASAKPRPAVLSNSRAKYVGGTVKAGDRVATLTDGDADGGRTPVVAESKSKFLPVSNSNSSKVLETVVEAVERFLKLHYLRSRSDAACMDILYGKEVVSDRELSFDLSGRSNMTQRGFRSLIKQLHFEDALQYVAIPTIRIEDNTGDKSNSSGSRRAGRDQSYKDGSGRDDLVQVFTTLRQKGVRTIIRAMVDDSFTPPHTDEAIEEALRGMDVEIWDWKKTDLSTEVIYTAAPRVREVHLYWSGNNTVLRGWSEEGGLKRLTELNSIHLHPQQGIESFRRTQQYVKDFTERIKRLGFKHDVQLFVDEGLGFRRQSLGDGSAGERSGVGIRGAKDELTSKHTWIDCMKRFRGLLLNAEASLDFQQVSQAIEENITVALIDDGVDGMDWDYPLLGGRTFYTRNEAEHLNHPYYASATGHGTAMAKLINFMCPRAKLYVLRLEDHPSEGGVRQITARSAAKAIAAAVKKGVHIISMSWTIEPPEDEGVRRELEEAISAADKSNILMFCSAADQGAKQTDTYPSRATRRIFTIGAAGPSGETNSWVGNPDKVNFTFPGDRVEIMDSTPNNITREISGSSAATALAAGFCALVMYCVQMRLMTAPEADKDRVRGEFAALKNYEGMMKTFRTIGTSPESNGKFIMVWQLFESKVNERDRYEDPDRLIEMISRVGAKIAMNVHG